MPKRPRIEAFKIHDYAFDLVPSPPERQWMDDFGDRHPYRCLPLSIANTHGWDILCPAAVEIGWNGGPLKTDLSVRALEPLPHGVPLDDWLRSHFTRGVVTFHTSYLFRTPPGYNLLVSGPHNHPKNGASAMTGIVESDWLPYPFTMNWIMTTPGMVRFEKGEPICTIMPIPKNYLGDWEVAVHALSDDPVMMAEHDGFREARSSFQDRLDAQDPDAIKQAWQRHYFVGRHPDGTMVADHTNKVRLAMPIDATGSLPLYTKPEPGAKQVAKIAIRINSKQPSLTTARPAEPGRPKAPPANWTSASILNRIDQTQNERNDTGRSRLQAGALSAPGGTIGMMEGEIRPGQDFIIRPDFLSADQCRMLAGFAASKSFDQHDQAIADPYWRNRVLFFSDILDERPDLAAIMQSAQQRVMNELTDFYDLSAPVYADTVQLVRWLEGTHMDPHADRANPDGSPHAYDYRDFASVIYLNDDYEGGEVYFTVQDMMIKPRAGTLIAFTGGWHHEHAVLKISRGTRFSMPAFYTFDETRKEKAFYA